MTQTDVFALQKSALATFLFSEVGVERSGLHLTVLSALARLGQDPWEEAGRWVGLPTAMTVDRLTKCISQMPLSAQALLDARDTAARLVQLLPPQALAAQRVEIMTARLPKLVGWTPVYVATGILIIAIWVSRLLG
jgi:hypothetical protein